MGELSGFGCALSAAAATLGCARQANDLFSKAGQDAAWPHMGAFASSFLGGLNRYWRRDLVRPWLRLYFVAGPQDCADLPAVLRAALAGGITAFQYRPKGLTPEEALAAGRELRALCAEAGVPFIVNDSVDLALALAADGLHLGQDDGQPWIARTKIGSRRVLGLSVSHPDHWKFNHEQIVDYIGYGPFAATQTKPDAREALGTAGLADLRQGQEQLPSVAIGGIGLGNLGAALDAGVDGVAVVSALAAAKDPAKVSSAMKDLILSKTAPK